MNEWRTLLTMTGKADDLLNVSKDNSMKMTRLFVMPEQIGDPETEETLDVSITSVNPEGSHALFDELLGRHMRITVEVDDERMSASWWSPKDLRYDDEPTHNEGDTYSLRQATGEIYGFYNGIHN